MVEPAVKSSEWSTWAALRAVGKLLLGLAFVAGWLWATARVDTTQHDSALLDSLSDTAFLSLVIVGIPAAYLWIRGRRRAEAEADQAGRSIKDAQDEYDDQPRPIMKLLLFISLTAWWLPMLASKVLALIESGPWLNAAVAGTLTATVVFIAALSFFRLLAQVLIAARKALAGGER